MSTQRKTVGEVSSILKEKEHENTHSAEEQMREQLEGYEANVLEAVNRGKRVYSRDFFVVVLTKKERLMSNVLRNYFFYRQTCPTPEYDQAVYQYRQKTDTLDFMWVVPSKHTCEMYKQHKVDIPQEEWKLLQHVLDFEDGTLLFRSKKLNQEEREGNKLCQNKKYTIPNSKSILIHP